MALAEQPDEAWQSLTVELTEHAPESIYAETDFGSITVDGDNLPEDAHLQAVPVSLDIDQLMLTQQTLSISDPQPALQPLRALRSASSAAETISRRVIKAFDISIQESGQTWQPEQPVRVELKLIEPVDVSADETLSVLHLRADGLAEPVSQFGFTRSEMGITTLWFDAGGFSIYAVVGETPLTHTFRFWNGEFLYETVILKGNETLPRIQNPEDAQGRVFIGWYLDEAYTQEFTGFDQAAVLDNGTTDLYACFADEAYTLTYTYNGSVIRTDRVKIGESYTFHADDPLFTIIEEGVKVNVAWQNRATNEKYTDGQTITVSADLILDPVIENRWLVRFLSDGGTQTASIYVAPGGKAEKPADPTWAGYAFGGWYTDSAHTSKFDFDSEITGHTDLYAYWIPQTTPYTVVIWAERPSYSSDANKYGYLTSYTKTGLTGTAVSFTSDDLPDAEQAIRNVSNGRMPYVYEYAVTEGITIQGNASTNVNVYYRSKTGRLYFRNSSGKTLFNAQYLTFRYGQAVELIGTFAESVLDWNYFTRFYPNGYSMASNWPASRKFSITYESACQSSSATDIADGASWYIQDNSAAENFYFIREYYHETIESAETEDGYKNRDNYQYNRTDARWFKQESEGAIHNGTTGFVTYHDLTTGYMSYTKNPNNYYSYHSYKSKDGTYYYYQNGKFGSGSKVLTSTTEISDGTECIIRFYCRRLKYNLYVDKGIGPYTRPSIDEIPYQKNLGGYVLTFTNNAGEQEEYKINESTWVSDGVRYIFRGFYDNAIFAGDPVDLSAVNMPVNGYAIFAKWEPMQVHVTYDVNGGTWQDAEDEQYVTLNYGEQAVPPTDPVKGEDAFLGWTLNGRTFSFTTPVTEDITLVAIYASTATYHLYYHRTDSGQGQEPTDANQYLYHSSALVAAGNTLTSTTGHTFVAWRAEDGSIYYPGDTIPIYQDTHLYALYATDIERTKLIYHMNYDTQGIKWPQDVTAPTVTRDGLINNTKVSLLTPDELSSAPDYTPFGYSFGGWYFDQKLTTGPCTDVLLDSSDDDTNIVYARWIPLVAEVSIVGRKEIQNLPTDQSMADYTGCFQFQVEALNGAPTDGLFSPVWNAADGSIDFGTLTFTCEILKTEAGAYLTSRQFVYLLAEVVPENPMPGIAYIADALYVTIEVTYDAAARQLTAEIVSVSTDNPLTQTRSVWAGL